MLDLLVFEELLSQPPDAYSMDKLHRMAKEAADEIRRLRRLSLGYSKIIKRYRDADEIKGV